MGKKKKEGEFDITSFMEGVVKRANAMNRLGEDGEGIEECLSAGVSEEAILHLLD